MTEDLFSSDSHTQARRARNTPLAVRMRPKTLDEVVGQKHLLTEGSPLRVLAEGSKGPARASSAILYGPPGTGKTTIAHVIAQGGQRKFVELSAIRAGVKDVRQVMDQALQDRDLRGITTVLFMDEIHRFNKAQQDALLPGVENGWVILVAATTENPSFSVIAPLLSRSLLLTLQSLGRDDLTELIDRALTAEHGLDGYFSLDDDAREHILRVSGGDARRVLTTLEAAAAVASGRSETTITGADAQQAADFAVQRYDKDGDQHYDIVSAFIKSLRGSDVDAALHYLARMLVAGEDPRFIARRLMVHASEDIGMADPTALQAATAAAEVVQKVGMPECRLALAQATIHLATAPKSKAVIAAIDAAMADVRAGGVGEVPRHLRDGHYAGAKGLGNGVGYRYPHSASAGVLAQQYPPDELVGRDYYEPGPHGHERELAARVDKLRTIIRG